MLYLPVNTGPFHFDGGSFQPYGPIAWGNIAPRRTRRAATGTLPNPVKSLGRPLAVRFFVGFNVGSVTRWTLADLIEIVREVLVAQTGTASATFAGQTGIYTHFDGTMVVEPGAQVWVMDNRRRTRMVFQRQMIALTEAVRARLEQESILVEIQRSGATLDTLSVFARPARRTKRRSPMAVAGSSSRRAKAR